MNENTVIEIINLSKTYKGNHKPSVDHISLNISRGEIFGLLGPNGAGKTTTISILCGLFAPSKGDVYIDGLSVRKNKEQVKNIIGIIPQDIALYPSLTAKENLQFIGRMYGLKSKVLKERILKYTEFLGMQESLRKKINTFSGGMKRRINLVAGLLHEPKIVILDEPTVGVDVQSRNQIVQYLRELNRNGTTILYTSHYLQEAESLCSKVAFMDNGKIIIRGTPQQLISGCPGCQTLEEVFLKLTGIDLRD
ncbi:MAG: ABC transporter ATP-binding protein [Bacteroidales bacterium]|jgi:ABC-2 type transport system ATP-binding protein|nr:ABC transporter ATP-binding protein [Bacteroidales bacterium]